MGWDGKGWMGWMDGMDGMQLTHSWAHRHSVNVGFLRVRVGRRASSSEIAVVADGWANMASATLAMAAGMGAGLTNSSGSTDTSRGGGSPHSSSIVTWLSPPGCPGGPGARSIATRVARCRGSK